MEEDRDRVETIRPHHKAKSHNRSPEDLHFDVNETSSLDPTPYDLGEVVNSLNYPPSRKNRDGVDFENKLIHSNEEMTLAKDQYVKMMEFRNVILEAYNELGQMQNASN